MSPNDLPNLEAHWWPVRLETVPGSGETLTVAVVVRSASGQSSVRQAIPPSTLSGLFGSAGKGMQLIVGNTVLSLQRQLDQGVPVENLQPPFGNAGLGQARDCVAHDLNEVHDIAMRMSSAFSLSQFGHDDSIQTVDVEARAAFEEWTDKVRTQVLLAEMAHATERFQHAFNVAIPMSSRKKARVGFVLGGYVAQFGVLRPGKSIHADVRALKLKLFDVQMLRRVNGLQFQHADLIVGCQEAGDSYTARQRDALSASWEFVATEAKALNVVPVKCGTAASAARHIEEAAFRVE